MKHIKLVVIAVGVVLLGSNIIRAVVNEPATVATARDAEVAARQLEPVGGVDERLSNPAGAWVGGLGVIEPRDREIKLAGSVGGRIAEIIVHEGDHVAAGTVLVKLEDAVERAALAEAEADLRNARSDNTRVTRGSRQEDIDAVTAEAEASKARAELAAGVAERLQRAADGGGATRDEVDRAMRTAEADAATARQTAARREASVKGSRQEDVMGSSARVAAAEARLTRAQANWSERSIRAPVAGEVLQVKFRAGEYYQPAGAEPLVVLGDTSELHARIDVDERDVGRVRIDAAALVRTNAFPGEDFQGRVIEIARRMGRRNVRTDDPIERNDTKILEVVLRLNEKQRLVIGQRVMGYIGVQ